LTIFARFSVQLNRGCGFSTPGVNPVETKQKKTHYNRSLNEENGSIQKSQLMNAFFKHPGLENPILPVEPEPKFQYRQTLLFPL
jgi:hypothetical protein